MKKKQFKAESKRLLDLMVNSIYTNKEIFLRELISNASDAIDKLNYQSLTNHKLDIDKDTFHIQIDIDKEKRTLTISDNGCGMTEEELENNLGTIAQSGSMLFKQENEKQKDIDIIGQFGVGFYSAFMVSDEITVTTKSYKEEQAYQWNSKGAEGYTIEPTTKAEFGTSITLYLKEDSEEENYSTYLETYTIERLIKKYSDYIRYPIKMYITEKKPKENSENEYIEQTELKTINSMIPIWKKKKNEVTEEEYYHFYMDKFADYEHPQKVIHSNMEGTCSYQALLFIPNHTPYDFYSKDYEKGLELYSNGVLIMEKCKDLLPDYFSFVKGLIDSSDLSLNISREILQQDRQLKQIAKSIEGKIKKELEDMLKNNREQYEQFFKNFGNQLKFGIYNNFGMNKDKLKDLLLFHSSKQNKQITLKEYVETMQEGQEKIYYVSGETISKIDSLPLVEKIKEKGLDLFYLTDYIDEFVLQTIGEYDQKQFINIATENADLDTEEEKEQLKQENEQAKEIFQTMKETLQEEIADIRFTNRLKNHPVCLTTEGAISIGMQKVINAMPTDEKVTAKTVLEININHPIVEKLKQLQKENIEELKTYTKILYAQARLIEGLSLENPTEISNLICDILVK